MEITAFESALQIILSLSKGGNKFLQLCDKLRYSITPKDSYPGFIEKLSTKTIKITCNVLNEFSGIIFDNPKRFGKDHISRAIDAMNKESLGYAIIYLRTHQDEMFMECIHSAKNAYSAAVMLSKEDILFCASSCFNIGAYMFKEKEYAPANELFNITIRISRECNNNLLMGKAYRHKGQCMLALEQHETDEFIYVIKQCDDISSILYSWVCLKPPKNPEIIAEIIKYKNHQYAQSQINKTQKHKTKIEKSLIFYFILNGYFCFVPKNTEYEEIFPNMKSPNSSVLFTEKCDEIKLIQRKYDNCNSYFKAKMFTQCKNEAISLLQDLQDLTNFRYSTDSYLILFFIYFWIIESFMAIDKDEEAIWYSNEMRKIFKLYPFSAGFALYLETKSKLHIRNFDGIKNIPKLRFSFKNGSKFYSWEHLLSLIKAVKLYNEENLEECFIYFQAVIDCGNPLIICEAMQYYIEACRNFHIFPDILEFYEYCTSDYYKALYNYHSAIQLLINEDIDLIWEYKNCRPSSQKILKILKEAEKYAYGYTVLQRNIMQLQALAIGNNDPIKTAFLISISLSQSLDTHITSSTGKSKFQIPFPLLAITFIDVPGLDKCLLFAFYHPTSKPIVIRIKDNFCTFKQKMEEINEIEVKSSNVSSLLPKEEWWTIKRNLDSKLGEIVAQIEEFLGVWKGLFAPIIYKPNHSSNITTLVTSLKFDSSLRTKIEEMLGTRVDVSQFTVNKVLPLGLILGKTVHRFPWESLPIVSKYSIGITRIPSLRLVALHCDNSSLPMKVDPKTAFFILNPQGDLENTEKTFMNVFTHDFEWDGNIGSLPDSETVKVAIRSRDLFVYCGHGSGTEYFNYTKMAEDGLHFRAAMLLMGCKSGELTEKGESEPKGIPLAVVACGSGAVVGNLWNVTDRDIDRFTLNLLERTVANGPCSLEEGVAQARTACRLRYLTGAAPVVYGFPTVFK